jgi:hypothetical protein
MASNVLAFRVGRVCAIGEHESLKIKAKAHRGLKPKLGKRVFGTTEKAAEKVRKADPSGLKPLGMTKSKRLNGTDEAVL